MSSTKFDPEKDIAPIPFNEEVCQLALEMKRLGLMWLPTWHQARSICRRLEITDDVIFNRLKEDLMLADDLENIYESICSALKKKTIK